MTLARLRRVQSARSSRRCSRLQNNSAGLHPESLNHIFKSISRSDSDAVQWFCGFVVRSRCKEAGDTARGGADRYGVVWRSKYEPGGLETALLARRPALAPALQGLLGLRTKLQVRAPNDISTFFLYDVSERNLSYKLLRYRVIIRVSRYHQVETSHTERWHTWWHVSPCIYSVSKRSNFRTPTCFIFHAYLLSRERANSTNVYMFTSHVRF